MSSSNRPSNVPHVTGAASAASTTTAAASSNAGADNNLAAGTTIANITDQAVLEYLKSKGMATAVLELSQKLKGDKDDPNKKDDTTTTTQAEINKAAAVAAGTVPPSKERLSQVREQLEAEDEAARTSRTVLTKSTGGGYGYDRDAAAPIAQWGVPDTIVESVAQRGKLGEREAKSYLDAFVALQLWILSLPDDSLGNGTGWQPRTENVIAKAKALITNGAVGSADDNDGDKKDITDASTNPAVTSEGDDGKGEKKDEAETQDKESTDVNKQKVSLTTVLSELVRPAAPLDNSASFPLPPSAKQELLSVSFALLVHTYCELLEVGMETTAHVLRDAFKPIYDPIYGEEYKDLYHCVTTEDMVKLNTHNSQHMEALSNLKGILVQIVSYQQKQEELSNAVLPDAEHERKRAAKLQEYNQTIGLYQQRHSDISQRASIAFEKMYDLPFLRRARAVRWQITLSTMSYGMLCQFMSCTGAAGDDTSMLAMSTLLQTKCELHVEQRDPLPFTPAVILDDNSAAGMSTTSREKYKDLNKDTAIRWAAPAITSKKEKGVVDKPFPSFNLEEEYEDERSARRGKRAVEFNRAILINGFRRLEALERKRNFEVMSSEKKNSVAQSGTSPGKEQEVDPSRTRVRIANPLEPSILLSTLCANQARRLDTPSKTTGSSKGRARTSSIAGSKDASASNTGSTPAKRYMSQAAWEESGIGITCAKLCRPDGRKVAIGCDDSAIRVWNLLEDLPKNGFGGSQVLAGDASQVLLGHKNGFPVFDLSWNRDGRCLLSAGGDGSIRLWDTAAQGPFGEVVSSSKIKASSGATKKVAPGAAALKALNDANANLEKAKKNPDMSVPGSRRETRPYKSGTALAVYRGHAPNTPIWSVAFAPCGYYFASAGSDATARLWTTDRPVPVRLFTGHTSNSVHSVVFHPNCNYVLTGSEDKTARLWDIQTGKAVRVLNGCPSGIYKVDIDPSGQYAVGADLSGTVHLWDLASGKKVTEFRASRPAVPAAPAAASSQRRQHVNMIHSFAFSACGTALATGGDDRCVRVWDINKSITDPSPVVGIPAKSFATRRTMVLDLQYTQRNLLLSVGKYIAAIPAINLPTD